jgi:8-oxo-dGTP diphosphatase
MSYRSQLRTGARWKHNSHGDFYTIAGHDNDFVRLRRYQTDSFQSVSWDYFFSNFSYAPFYQTPKVGVGVFVISPTKEILLGLRRNSHGAGEWSLPGGHLNPGESLLNCAIREVKEETDIDIQFASFVDFTEDLFPTENLHYITMFYKTQLYDMAVPSLMEPEKCAGWEWFPTDNLPKPLFKPLKNIIEYADIAYKTKGHKKLLKLWPELKGVRGL